MFATTGTQVSHEEEARAEPEEGEFWDSARAVPLQSALVKRAREDEINQLSIILENL